MISELARRVAITIGALLIYRLGSHVPVTGISMQSGLLSSSAVARISIFSLTLVPHLGAAITSGNPGAVRSPRDPRSWPIKVNGAGLLIPATVAPWLWSLPLAFAVLVFGRAPWLVAAYEDMRFGKPAHLILVAIGIFVFAFIYTAYVLDPEHAADSLGKQGGVIPDVAPGEPSADYLDRAVSLTMIVGAAYLTLSLIPEALLACGLALPYKISGGSALIVVCTILDLKKQVRDVSLTNRGGERR